ncbi:MAG: ABC transporter ATP-binding protein [Candidatus Sumerlaeia bacterium]|nr:ABC transporter ATP-binding protein [Candidatus Sumerlaeia bacterium]
MSLLDPDQPTSADDVARPSTDTGRRPSKARALWILTQRNTVVRIIAYLKSYRRLVFAGVLVGILASFIGAANILALLPALQVILDPEGSAPRIERLEAQAAEREARWAERSPGERTLGASTDYHWDRLRQDGELWMARFQEKERERAVFWIVGVLLAAQTLNALLEFYSKFQLQKAFLFASNKIRMDLYDRSLALDLSHFREGTTGDLIGRLNNDVRQVRTIFGALVGNAATVPFKILFNLLVLFVLNARLTLIAAVALPLVVVPLAVAGNKLRRMARQDEEEDVRLIDVIAETLQSLPIVKVFGTEQFERERFREKSRAITRRQIRREMIRLAGGPFVDIVNILVMGLVICAGAYIILKSDNADMSAPAFFVYLIALTRFYQPMKGLSQSYMRSQKAVASAERIFEIMDAEPEVRSAPDALSLPPIRRGISMRDVWFRYGSDRDWALRGVSAEIPAGSRVALVGRSGSGKSTLARLVPRLYDAERGAIAFDGTDLRDATVESIRRQIAYVTQDTLLFNESIRYNILYGRTDATEEEMLAAARAANAHGFIAALPQGYDTEIGERGGQLSGGQRQRIAIARAILRDAPILILDEATSALDNESEAAVNEALERLMEGRTTIVIAHRLSTVRRSDAILVMEEGAVVERGTHQELLAAGGKYAELCALAELRDPETGTATPP